MRISPEMIDDLPGNVYWKDKEGRYIECNRNTLNFFQLTSKDDLLGKTEKKK